MPEVNKTLKDALYVTVGLGVIAFQKAQVRRQELRKQLDAGLKDSARQLERLSKEVQVRLDPVLDQLTERLPEGPRDVVSQARTAAKATQSQVLARLGRTPAAA